MKRLILLAFVAVAAAKLTPEEQIAEILRRVASTFDLTVTDVQDCVKSSGTGEEDILYLTDMGKDELHKLHRTSCLMACCAKKQGTMVGMKMNVPKVMKIITNHEYPEPYIPDELKQIRDSLTACNEEVTEAKDECKAIYELGMCIRDKNELKRTKLQSGIF